MAKTLGWDSGDLVSVLSYVTDPVRDLWQLFHVLTPNSSNRNDNVLFNSLFYLTVSTLRQEITLNVQSCFANSDLFSK